MDLAEAISGRRSVREYTPDMVDELTLYRLVDAAVHAPNAVNQQRWAFTVIRGQALLDRISDGAKEHMLQNLPHTAFEVSMRNLLSDPKFQIFYHAPVLVLIAAASPGAWIVEDCALAAENLMLAAYAAGLGTCWIGFAQGYLNTPAGKALLDLPQACVPVAPIIVGHPKAPPPPVTRNAPQIRWLG